jgi:hypothetical protein
MVGDAFDGAALYTLEVNMIVSVVARGTGVMTKAITG